MSTFVGKISNSQEAVYVRQIIRAAGISERQFVRAALLAYCGILIEKATQMEREADATRSGDTAGNLESDERETTSSAVPSDEGNTVVESAAE
jgi:hypothetical protein